MSGPVVLVMGGCGFVGRHLVSYLVTSGLASKVVVADKSLPVTSNLDEHHKAIFERKDIVEFKQVDLSKDPHVDKVFSLYPYHYVFNCCGETRFGMSEEEYKQKSFISAQKCSLAAAKQKGVGKWVEVSSAQVYTSDEKPSSEESKTKPWTVQAKYRLEAETAVMASGVPTVILRPSIIYGPGDLSGLTPRIACAAVYQEKKEKMNFLWGKSLKTNVVHVHDVVRAMWMCAEKAKAGSVYNLADTSQLEQGTLNGWIGDIFGIETGFHGAILSNLAKVALNKVAEEANDAHVPGFTNLCAKHKVENTPISAFIDKELLSNNHLSVDGTKITKEIGFKYEKSPITKELLKEQIVAAIKQGIFPPVIST